MKKRFKISEKNPYEDKDKTIKNYYQSWRVFNKGNDESKEKFTMLFNSFKDNVLPDIEGGALKLYLFFSFSANNQDGDSFYSIEKLAAHLNVDPRTVNKWIKILTDRQLIHRDTSKRSRALNTYLLPYSTTLMRIETNSSFPEDNQELVDHVLESLNLQKVIFGELIGTFHLFQWQTKVSKIKSAKGSLNTQNVQWLLFITKRTNGVLTGHYLELNNSANNLLAKKNIEDFYYFKSPFTFQNRPFLGVALDNEINLKDTLFEPMKTLIEDLAVINIDIESDKRLIEYGVNEVEEIEIDDTV